VPAGRSPRRRERRAPTTGARAGRGPLCTGLRGRARACAT